MSSFAGKNPFASGPHSIRPGSWRRSQVRRGFAELDGELVIDNGLRGRCIEQTGRLVASSASQLHALIGEIEELIDGRTHTLIDNHGHVYSNVMLESFEPRTPLRKGRSYWCDYVARYLQLP
ncbi:MAG: hypothetical protein ACP5HU_10985 [Phycisphaerae bacterium]